MNADVLRRLCGFADMVADTQKQYYILCGNQKGGKKTLIHYLLGAELQFDIDAEGQDVLNIPNPLQKQTIVDNILQCYNFTPESSSRYIWLNGFPTDYNGDARILWCLCYDYILRLIADKKCKLIFTLPPLMQDIEPILNNFYQTFKTINNLSSKTVVVLTRVYGEQQRDQFISNMVAPLEETNQPLYQIFKEISDKQQIYCFYANQVQQDQRSDLQSKLSIDGKSIEELGQLQVKELFSKIDSVVWEEKQKWKASINQIYDSYCQIVNMLMIVTLELKSGKEIMTGVRKELQQKWKQIFGEKIDLEVSEEIKSSQIIESCQIMFLKHRQQPDILFKIVQDELQKFRTCYKNQQKKLITIQTLLHIAQSFNQDSYNQHFESVFSTGMLSNKIFHQIYQIYKEYFSTEIKAIFEKKKQKSNKKKTRKIVSAFPDYQIQKKQFQGTIKQVLQLNHSPLKFDFLIEELHLSVEKGRNFMREKILIKSICQVLEFYNMFEESIIMCKIVPDFNSIEQLLEQIVLEIQKNNLSMTSDRKKFINQTIQFCLQNNRRYLVDQIINFICHQDDNQEQLKIKYDEIEQKAFDSECNSEVFMNIKYMKEIYNDKSKIIERMIEFEYQNWKQIQLEICLQELIKSDLNLFVIGK